MTSKHEKNSVSNNLNKCRLEKINTRGFVLFCKMTLGVIAEVPKLQSFLDSSFFTPDITVPSSHIL